MVMITGVDVVYGDCNIEPCPRPGMWLSWVTWSPCSATCGEGLTRRARDCFLAFPHTTQCTGKDREHMVCHTGECPYTPLTGMYI